MKRLSDYTDGEAIELWADLLEPMGRIIQDKSIRTTIQSGQPAIVIARDILKDHADDAAEILQRIDPAPLTGLNIVIRLVALFEEISSNDDMKGFFGFAETQMVSESSGSATANTGDAEA